MVPLTRVKEYGKKYLLSCHLSDTAIHDDHMTQFRLKISPVFCPSISHYHHLLLVIIYILCVWFRSWSFVVAEKVQLYFLNIWIDTTSHVSAKSRPPTKQKGRENTFKNTSQKSFTTLYKIPHIVTIIYINLCPQRKKIAVIAPLTFFQTCQWH